MGKYDSIFNGEEYADIELNEAEGLAAMVVIAALADDPQEMIDPDLFLDTLSFFEMFAPYSEEDLLELVDRLVAISTEEGMGALFNAMDEAIPDDLVPDVYAAAICTLIDPNTGEIPTEKKEFLKELQLVLDVDDEEVREITSEVRSALEEPEEN
jgi:hypothetical protein